MLLPWADGQALEAKNEGIGKKLKLEVKIN